MREHSVLLNFIYVSKQHGGGKDQVALNLLQGISENGDSKYFILVCYDYLKSTVKEIAPDMEVITVKSKKRQSELFRLLDIERVNTFIIPDIIKKTRVSMVFHCNCTNGVRKLKVKSVMIPHDIKAVSHRVMGEVRIPMYKYILYRLMYAVDFRHADKIIAISKNDKSEMRKFYPKYYEKIVQIYNPIKVAVDGEGVSIRGEDIVAINLQFHHKNIITLIKAFEQAKDMLKGNLILVGSVPKRVEYLRQYVESHGLSDRVIFTGFVEGSEKRKLLASCGLYVNPSLFEGFGMTAVEAMILKAPTLLSRVSANYEVTKGLARYYEPADDVSALAEALVSYFENPCNGQDLENASRVMLDNYNHTKIAKDYMELFSCL